MNLLSKYIRAAVLLPTLLLCTHILRAQSATFVKQDTATGANWQGVYGADGYAVAPGGPGAASYIPTGNFPGYATSSGVGPNTCGYTWSLQYSPQFPTYSASGTPTWYACSGGLSSFTIDLNLTDGNPHQVAVFAFDTSQGRTETLSILNGASVLNSQSISNYTRGVWVVWTITGHVTIQATGTAGPNATITSIMLGGATSSGGGGTPQVVLNWTASTTTGIIYVIYRSTGATACTTSSPVIGTVSYGTNTFTDTNVTHGTTYNYCVTEVTAASVASGSASATP